MAGELTGKWKELLSGEFAKEYMIGLKKLLSIDKKNGQIIYPPGSQIFSAFNQTPFEKVKVVIIGQDPYHGVGQAHGLSFSVQKGVRIPPSLQNIFKELQEDIPNFNIPSHGDLSKWAAQGVLMLNATLTVRASQPGSHQKLGWEEFTDKAIKILSEHHQGLVFLLWGRFAQSKEHLIDSSRHYILKAAHPSPFSAHSGFLGCKHFSLTNELLRKQGKTEISWLID